MEWPILLVQRAVITLLNSPDDLSLSPDALAGVASGLDKYFSSIWSWLLGTKHQGGDRSVKHSQGGHSECGLGHWQTHIFKGKNLALKWVIDHNIFFSQAIALERMSLFFIGKHLHSYPQARDFILPAFSSHLHPSLGDQENTLKILYTNLKTLA